MEQSSRLEGAHSLTLEFQETMKVVLSWQYLNCLKFWATMVGVICSTAAQEGAKPSQLSEITYSLVEISTQLMR